MCCVTRGNMNNPWGYLPLPVWMGQTGVFHIAKCHRSGVLNERPISRRGCQLPPGGPGPDPGPRVALIDESRAESDVSDACVGDSCVLLLGLFRVEYLHQVVLQVPYPDLSTDPKPIPSPIGETLHLRGGPRYRGSTCPARAFSEELAGARAPNDGRCMKGAAGPHEPRNGRPMRAIPWETRERVPWTFPMVAPYFEVVLRGICLRGSTNTHPNISLIQGCPCSACATRHAAARSHSDQTSADCFV